MIVGHLDVIDATTKEWQCTVCNHLCKLLLDSFVKPSDVIKCKNANFHLW